DHVSVVVRGPDDAGDDIAVLAQAIGIQYGDGHDTYTIRADASNAGVVIRDGGDDAGQPGAVAMRIVPAVRTIEDRGARIDVGSEVRMVGVNPGIEDRHGGGVGGVNRAIDRVPADLRQGPLGAI